MCYRVLVNTNRPKQLAYLCVLNTLPAGINRLMRQTGLQTVSPLTVIIAFFWRPSQNIPARLWSRCTSLPEGL